MRTRRHHPTSMLERLYGKARCQRSSALIIVLGCLVLISILIVGFFASVATERQSAQFYANSSSVKLLSDSTVSIVTGMIKDATKGTDSSGNVIAWASQPGMIRNYNTQQSAATAYYKLYSWNDMVTNAFTPGSASETPPATWTNSPAVYTDLNDPVSGVYPIVDPAAQTVLKVAGFSISGAPVSSHNTAPMPVKWLYVLQSGQVIAPDASSSGNKATFLNATVQPSQNNQVVGRIAFWTDDDTCKVNINTAAGDVWVNPSSPPGNPGSFWDTPRTYTAFDYTNLALYQPANGEYQRYPGHPATTYLSAVFPNLTSAQIYSLAPRVTLGGSLSGTTYATNSLVATDDNDRLYSSVDELLFNTNLATTRGVNSPLTKTNLEQARFFLTAASRAPEVNLYNQPRVVIWPISSTNDAAHRTAYDNLIAYCGTLSATNNTSGTFSTNNAYYFQRSNAYSQTADLPTAASATGLGRNRALITYLRNLTGQPIPGFSQSGETFLSKYPQDRDQILTEIFDYIRTENTQDPGVTSPFTPASYAAGEGQVVPITDTGSDGTTPLRGFGHMPIIAEATLLFAGIGETDASGANSNYFVFPAGAPAPAKGMTRVQAALLFRFYDVAQGYALTIPNFRVSVTGLNSMSWSSGTNSGVVGFPNSSFVKVATPTAISWPTGDSGISQLFGTGGSTGFLTAASGFVGQQTLDCPTGGTFAITDTKFNVYIQDYSSGTTNYQSYSMEFPAGAAFPVPQVAPFVADTSTNNVFADFRNLTANPSSYIVGNTTNSVNPRFAYSSSGLLQNYICGKDVVRSIVLTTDPRMVAATTTVPSAWFNKIQNYDNSSVMQAHAIVPPINNGHRPYVGAVWGKLVPNICYDASTNYTVPYNPVGVANDFVYSPSTYTPGVQPQVASANPSGGPMSGNVRGLAIHDPTVLTLSGGYATPVNGIYVAGASSGVIGDWDNGNGPELDGGYINKVDEGSIPYSTQIPYFGAGYATNATGTKAANGTTTILTGASFSPNRQVPSAGMFGSLSTGVKSNRPWQTLLFRPDPDGNKTHIGAQTPQDHLLLDLFNMPIVEPYAISDPFSTAGKVNMNYQIVPFTYINRSTALQAVMRSEQILAIPATEGASYKSNTSHNYRNYLDIPQTLTGFNNRFANGDIFRSASEICNIWLVPYGQTYANMQSFWTSTTATGGILTGDNSRERPYTNLYPRLTTKSNTYTVHMRVQTLKQVKAADPTYATWVEGTDAITGEYRGSTTLERYLDTSDTRIPDYATTTQPLAAGQAIDNFYKFRVVETKQFTP